MWLISYVVHRVKTIEKKLTMLPPTKAQIPTIINVALSNFSMEGTNLKDDSKDNSHLGEYPAEFYVRCDSNVLLIVTVVVQHK